MDFLKKIKAIILLLILCLFFKSSFGQIQSKIRLSLETGIDRVYYRNYLGSNHWGIGSTIGVNGELVVNNHLSFLAGAAYASRNINAGVVWISSSGNIIPGNLFSERHLKLLEFSPISIRYRFSNKNNPVSLNPIFQTGLITSFAFSDKRTVITDVETTTKNYPGFKAFKQGVEFGGGVEYTLKERVFISLLLTARITRVVPEARRFEPESPFDKIAAQMGITYSL